MRVVCRPPRPREGEVSAPMSRDRLSILATAFGDNRVHVAVTALAYLDRAEAAEEKLAKIKRLSVTPNEVVLWAAIRRILNDTTEAP